MFKVELTEDENTDDFETEVEKVCQNPELMQFLEERSKERNTYSIAAVRERLDLK